MFDLSINKTPKSKSVVIGEEFDYTLTVQNNGQTGVTDFTVNDYLPIGLDYVSSTANGGYNAQTRTVYRDNLSIGATDTLVLTVRVKYV